MTAGLLLPGGDRLSRLGLGTAGLHRIAGASRRNALIEAALASGVTHFDTAPYYGFGFAEAELGRVLAGEPGVTIATKVGLAPPRMMTAGRGEVIARKALGKLLPVLSGPRVDWRVTTLAASLARSLDRLRRPRVRLLLLHEPGRTEIAFEPVVEWLDGLVREGIVGTWGMAGELADTLVQARRAAVAPPVLQLRDAPPGAAARAMEPVGRAVQLTYGYFSRGLGQDGADPMTAALVANPNGTILFATHRPERIAAFAALARDG